MKNHSKTYAKVIFALSLLLGLSLGQIHRQYKHIQELENEHFFDVEVPSVYLHSHHHEHHHPVNRERLRVQMEELQRASGGRTCRIGRTGAGKRTESSSYAI